MDEKLDLLPEYKIVLRTPIDEYKDGYAEGYARGWKECWEYLTHNESELNEEPSTTP